MKDAERVKAHESVPKIPDVSDTDQWKRCEACVDPASEDKQIEKASIKGNAM